MALLLQAQLCREEQASDLPIKRRVGSYPFILLVCVLHWKHILARWHHSLQVPLDCADSGFRPSRGPSVWYCPVLSPR